jgi:hypothetical protein
MSGLSEFTHSISGAPDLTRLHSLAGGALHASVQSGGDWINNFDDDMERERLELEELEKKV